MSNWDKIEGEVKEQGGKLTDDESMEYEGKAQKGRGEVEEKVEDAKDELEERL
jgi:uncharacterized protein YjbJ (UPF0337 family)